MAQTQEFTPPPMGPSYSTQSQDTTMFSQGQKDQVLTATPAAPITIIRPVADDLDQYIPKPQVARAIQAVSKEHPQGTENYDTRGFSVLQQHVAFFDRNNDGIIYPWETYTGFRAVDFNMFFSALATLIIHLSFSYITLDSWIPSPLFAIIVKNIHKSKHGSDSGVYDREGRFVPQRFEDLFTQHDKDRKGALTLWELIAMMKTNRNIFDPFGWFAAVFEWGTTWLLIKNERGLMSKDDIRGVFDGSLFYNREIEVRERSMQQSREKTD